MSVDYRRERHKALVKAGLCEVSVAKMRWRLLARTLQEGRVHQSDPYPCSVRRFSTYGLIKLVALEDADNSNEEGVWYRCTCKQEPRLRLKIRLLSDKITYEGLVGVDNTGNVCIWPSEEVLGYYSLKNKSIFGGKTVCELGGGMTCLTSLMVAASTSAREVFATDGNTRSVENVQRIIEKNMGYFGSTHVVSRLLRWGVEEDIADCKERFDVILCADCLYFDEGREPLCETIWKIMKKDGIAVVVAPTRGETFKQFVELVKTKFQMEWLFAYDTYVWELHCRLKFLESGIYNEDLHYPQMLLLKKV